MRQNPALTIASLLSILLTTIHVTADALHAKEGIAPRGVTILLLMMLIVLYGTTELSGRRSGYVIMLLGGALAAAVPYLHGVGPGATKWGFSFVWPLFALGVTGSFTVVLSTIALWRSFRHAA